MTGESTRERLQDVLELLRSADLEGAHVKLRGVLKGALSDPEALYALAGVNFWREKARAAEERPSPFERGEALVSEWKAFLPFMRERGEDREAVLYALKRCAFSLALDHYLAAFGTRDVAAAASEAELYRKMGLCRKALGEYEEALSLLDHAKDADRDSAAILAELADCYALCGDERFAKVFFREAFFKDAEGVEMSFLESDIITRLALQVEAMGYRDEALLEWMPVYGVLLGVFNVKRALRPVEVGKLKQDIFSLKEELKVAGDGQRRLLVPRLINRYFWLIDHLSSSGGEKARINDCLLEIRLLDKDIYDKYIM